MNNSTEIRKRTDTEKKRLITDKLREIEQNNNVRILLAVESGSRAWGFASPDSDYDVRFIYIRSKNDYLRLDTMRDVIEVPINDELDINGWDLQKALRLLYRANPTLFEWFTSPIVYLDTELANELRKLVMGYFVSKKSLYHYISMAEGNYREYLRGDMVKAKKYLYVLRPVLACRWVLEKGTPPPMLFSDLSAAELPAFLKPDIDRLLELKMNSPEIREIPRIALLNDYLDSSIVEIKAKTKAITENGDNKWEPLNRFFIRAIKAD